jgi:membrane protein implicated in regulation of membrane protease activity
MIQMKSPNLVARALAPFAQMLNKIALRLTIPAPGQPLLGSDTAKKFEQEAVVDEEIQPNCVGRVHFQATWWPARCPQEIILAPGQIVCVVGIENITLLVLPL